MDIIGGGFLARHLAAIVDSHPRALVLAAGVVRPENTEAEYRRETELVAESIGRCRRDGRVLVFFSTTLGLYGGPGCRGREDEAAAPLTRYGRHKLSLERMLADSGVAHLSLRLAHIVGPHGPSYRLMPSLVAQIQTGRVTIFRHALRDVLYVGDFVAIVDGLLRAGVTRQVVNVASGQAVRVERIVDHLEARLGVRADRQLVDAGAAERVCAAKLRRLLSGLVPIDFGPGYYRTVVDRYLADTDGLCRDPLQTLSVQ
jgi:NDP-hexose 4-ketoreductase